MSELEHCVQSDHTAQSMFSIAAVHNLCMRDKHITAQHHIILVREPFWETASYRENHWGALVGVFLFSTYMTPDPMHAASYCKQN